MANRTSIRLNLRPSQTLACLEILESYGETTEGRNLNNCVEQLLDACMQSIVKTKGISLQSDIEAARILRERGKRNKQRKISIPEDELNYIETTVDDVIKEKRMQDIKDALSENVSATSNEPEFNYQSIFNGGDDEND